MIVLVAAAVLLAGAEWARRNGRRPRLAQARYRIGRLAGPTRGDFLLSEGLPIVDEPRQALPAASRCDCRYERVLFGKTWVTACVHCRRPPPTSLPSDGVPMSG